MLNDQLIEFPYHFISTAESVSEYKTAQVTPPFAMNFKSRLISIKIIVFLG